MLPPCLPPAHHAVALAHRVLHAVGQAPSQIGRQVMHRIQHVHHAVVTHTQAAVTVACQVAPAAIAMLALPPSAGPSQQMPPPSFISPEPVPLDALGPVAAIGPAFSTLVWRPSSTPSDPLAHTGGGSTIVTLLPAENVSPVNPVAVTLPPDPFPATSKGSLPGAGAVPDPFIPVLVASAHPAVPQPVPEPSSLVVMAIALCGMTLLRRTRPR